MHKQQQSWSRWRQRGTQNVLSRPLHQCSVGVTAVGEVGTPRAAVAMLTEQGESRRVTLLCDNNKKTEGGVGKGQERRLESEALRGRKIPLTDEPDSRCVAMVTVHVAIEKEFV